MKPLKRALLNSLCFLIGFFGVGLLVKHPFDWIEFLLLIIICFLVNWGILSAIDYADKH